MKDLLRLSTRKLGQEANASPEQLIDRAIDLFPEVAAPVTLDNIKDYKSGHSKHLEKVLPLAAALASYGVTDLLEEIADRAGYVITPKVELDQEGAEVACTTAASNTLQSTSNLVSVVLAAVADGFVDEDEREAIIIAKRKASEDTELLNKITEALEAAG